MDANKVKSVKIGTSIFEIPSHMDKAGMVECWKGEAEVLEKLAQDIVDNHRYFATEIVMRYCETLGYYLEPKDSKLNDLTTEKVMDTKQA